MSHCDDVTAYVIFAELKFALHEYLFDGPWILYMLFDS